MRTKANSLSLVQHVLKMEAGGERGTWNVEHGKWNVEARIGRHTSPHFDDDSAIMEWAIEQSREDHRKHQEVIAAAAFDSDEEGEAIERAIRESQLTKRCEEGNRYGQVRHVEGDGNEAMSINGHDVTQSERRSPGVQLVSSSWKSARGSGMSPVSSTRKEKKRKYATGSPIKVHGSPSCQRVLTDMFTTSPKKRKVSSEIEQIGIAPLPEQKQSRKVASEMESTGCPSLPEQPTGLHKKRRRPPPPLCLENPEQQDSAPSSAGTDKSVTPIKFSPHPSTLTKSGDRSFGGGCHEAVAEFVDNAIEASCGKEYATIEIHLFVSSEDEKKAAIAICDQGKGMTKKDIEDFACYSYNIKERHGVERPYQTSNESRHVDGRLSVYGVGSKNAAFHLGSRLTVITKCQDAKHMSYFCMDSQKLHSRFERNEETYIGDIIDYSPGDTECLHENELQDSNISNMVKEVSSHSHFTIILIGGLKKEHIMHLKKQHASEFRRGLAHIYHFYLHGIKVHSAGAETQNEHGHLLLQVLFYQQGKEIKEFHLKNETEDKESLYQLKAKSQFDFNVNLRIQEKSGDTVYQVKGVLLYFPKTLADGETLPFTFQDHELFECFWQGRLVTRTVLPCLNFCKLREQRVATQRDRLPDSCYRRLKGMLFFDRTMLTGHNKLSLLLPVDELRRLFDECIQKREEKKFNNWLSKCHKELDEEWEFCDEVDEGSGHFKTVKLCCSSTAVLRAGDKICVKRTNPLKYGEIKYFEHGQDSDYVVMDRRPQKLYPWTDKIPLSRLDFKDSRLDPGRWETCMDEQNRKLPVNLVVGCLEKGHCNLSDVVVCTPSNSVGSEGFWITLYDGNGETVKRLPGHKRDLVVGMRLQGPKTEHQIEGSTEGFNKVDLTDAGKHTFTFTIINRTKKQSIESQVVLLEWKHDVMVEADPPKVIHVISSDSEVRLGSESFSLHIEIMDQYRNPCKNVQATVALSCANKALQVVAPFDTFTTDESGRFLLSSIQFCPYRCSAQGDVIGQQRLSLLINKELNQKVDLTVSSGPPAGMELLKPLSVVEHNSVKENFVVKVVDAFNLPATVLAGEYYYVSARFLNNDIEGTTLQYSEALPVGSCNCIAIFRRLKVAFPDLKATNGQIEFMLWHREYPQNDGNSIEISRWVYDVHLIASTRPVRLLLYDSEGGALNDDEVLPAPVASHLQLEIEALDVKDQTVEVMKDSVPYRLQTTWTDGLITLKDLERGESQRLLLPPLTVTEKADSVICHSITLIEDDEEFPAFTINIKPQPGPASQVVIQKLKKGLAVGCGNKGDLHRLLSFFLTDEFGNKVHADETTNICAVITNPNQSDCYAEGDWHLEREVTPLKMGRNITRSLTHFRLPDSAVLVGCGQCNIMAKVAVCDISMTCSVQVQPGHPHRVEVCSNGFDQPQSFSDSHTLKFVWDMPLPVITAKLVDMGGNEVKKSAKSRQFTAEILAGSRSCSQISFTTKTAEDNPLTIPEGLTAEAFKIIVKSHVEQEIEPAVIKCLVWLTNRVKAISLNVVSNEMFSSEIKFVAGSQFPALMVTVETEDGLVAEIDWDDVKVTALSPGNLSFSYQHRSVKNCSSSYSYDGDSILTEAGQYKLVVEFKDQRQELQNIYPASQLQLRSEKCFQVVPGLVDHLLVKFPEEYPNTSRPVVVYGGTEWLRTLLPAQTFISAVDAYGNIVKDVNGQLGFKFVPESSSLDLDSTSAALPLESGSLKAILRSGGSVLSSPLVLRNNQKGAAPPGSYVLQVSSMLARRSVVGIVSFTLTAEGAESIVRKLQDCRKRKQDLQEETKNRKSAINEVKNCLRQIKTKLDKLKCSSLLQIADEPSMKDQIQQAQLQLAEMEKRKSSYRKAVYPPNYTKYRLPDSLASVALGRLVDLAFTEDDTHARLISSHLGDRVMSAVVFPRKENMEQYEQAPHRGCPAAVSLDVPSQAVLESIRNDLGELHIDFNWKLACDCVSTHNEGVGSLIKCLLKDTLVTDSLSSAKNLLEYCRNGNDLRAVPDVLSMDGYRVTGVGLVERLLDGPAESSFVFGEDHDSLSDMWQNWKKTVELLKAMHLTMIELEKKKRDYEEAVSRAKPELDQLSEKIATLDKQRCNMEGST